MSTALKYIGLSLMFFAGLSSLAQTDEHFCALGHKGSKNEPGQKYLTVQQESKANLYDVNYYFLDLVMTNQDASISGTARINGNTLAALDSIILELHQNFTISDLRLDGVSTPYNRYSTVLAIPILAASSGQSFQLEIDYAGTAPPIATNPAGVSGVYNTFVSAMNDKITFTISTPFYAHQWFPVKQILRDKADSSRVTLTVPTNCKAVSNGLLLNTTDNGNGTSTYEWNNIHPIGYNLIFAAVAPFAEYNGLAYPTQLGGSSVPINSYVYGSGATLTSITDQCDLIPGFLELFSDIYGLYPYSDQHYGFIAAPFGGGMEHQTMPTIGTFEKKVTAHELSHQWWGDKVGFRSFSDIWLSEGMATYAEYIMLENLYPAESTPLLLGWHSNVKTVVSGSVYHVDTFNLYRIYDSRLSYRKAASIIHTLRGIIDDDALFFQALSNYYNDFQDSVGSSAEFITSIQNSTGLDLTAFFTEWLYGQGFPKYSTIWNSVGNDLYLEISHTASYASVTPTFTNPIEIRFTRVSGIDTTIRFDINTNQDQFFIAGIGTVTGIGAIDPNNWVINNNGTNVNDPSFVGLNSINEDEIVRIYPNPAKSETHIELPDGNFKIRLISATGQTIEEFKCSKDFDLDLRDLEKGLYHLVIFSEESQKSYCKQLIKN